MTQKEDSGNARPLDLTNTFSMEVAWVNAHLSEFFKGLKGLRRTFTSAGKPGNYGINKDLMIVLVAEALKGQRIEPYQGSLLLATNLSEPMSDEGKVIKKWNDFLVRLIEIHTGETSFNHKRQTLIVMLMENGIENFDRLRSAGLARNYFHPEDPDYVDTLDDVLHHNNDNIPHDRRPADVTKESVEELQGNIPVKTYAAIPKDLLMPLLKEAMHEKRMGYVQAAAMLAINCHAMEKRRSGERYLDHIMAVAADPDLTPKQRVVAIMHDVIENSNYTVQDLEEMGFPKSLIVSLEHITKRPNERVYLKFIERLSHDPDALAVKMADIRHNSSDPPTTEKEALKREKYEIALNYLAAVQCGEIEAGSSIEEFARRIDLYKEIHFRSEPKKSERANGASNPGSSAPPAPPEGFAPTVLPT
jgi:DNA-binding protein Fis